MAKRARQRSSKQASSAGMKPYYKGMLAVHLENGAVTVRRGRASRAAPRLRAAAAAGWRHLQYRPGARSAAITVSPARPATNSWPRWWRPIPPALVGRRVVGEINLACAHCDWCRRGLGRHCPQPHRAGHRRAPRRVRGVLHPAGAQSARRCPTAFPLERAVFTEPLAAACEILDQVAIPCGDAGGRAGRRQARPAGRPGAECPRLPGAPIRPPRREAADCRRAPACPPSWPALRMPVAEYDWVVEATGSPEGLRTAAAMARPRGTVILKSTVHGDGSRRYRAHHRQRDDPGGLALRPLRGRPAAARITI